MLKFIPGIFLKWGPNKFFGLALALFSFLTGILLVTISGWFITATGLTGLGILSLLTYNLFLPSAAIRFLAVGRPLARYFEKLFTHKITLRSLRDSRVWVFENISGLKKEDLINFRNADLVSRLISDVDEMEQLYLGVAIPWLSMTLAFAIAAIVFSFYLPVLLWVIIGVYLISGLLLPWKAYQIGHLFEAFGIKQERALQNDFTEYLLGFQELKLFGLLGQYSENLFNGASKLECVRGHSKKMVAKLTMLSDLVIHGGLVASFWLIYRAGSVKISGAPIVLILVGIVALFEGLQLMPAIWHDFAKTVWAGKRLQSIVNPEQQNKRTTQFPTCHAISLSNISMDYGQRNIFHQINLVLPENSSTVMTGPNGAGKSSILDLLVSLRKPNEGLITIGGMPIDQIDQAELIRHIGYMEQQVTLFNISLHDNIALGKDGASAQEVILAAVKAGLGRFIEKSPDFLSILAGENGKNISGGQARMIALARIILKDAPIILMDEPTEALDEESEAKFCNLLSSWRGTKTILIVTHKESLLSLADFQININHLKNQHHEKVSFCHLYDGIPAV